MAVTDGTADPQWADVPLSTWRFRRRPALRLPLDAATARSVRRYARFAPWSVLPGLVMLAAWSALAFADLSSSGRTAAYAVGWLCLVCSVGLNRRPPRQTPLRTWTGDLRIPEVPVEVAEQWVAQNPGVIATGEPAPRRYSRRFYATWAMTLLLAPIGLAVVIATNGREDSVLLWMLVPVLFCAGVSLALKTQPPVKRTGGRMWPPGAASLRELEGR